MKSEGIRVELETGSAVVEPVPVENIEGMKEWLQAQAVAHGLKWLLAHADDGIIWGRLDDNQLKTSSDVAPQVSPPLRAKTLQSARLFSEKGELLLWRDGDNAWRARLIRDAGEDETADWVEGFDESQMLWGTHSEQLPDDFTLLRDGAQGLQHALPFHLHLDEKTETRPRLVVRHYITKEGFARVVASRLVRLEPNIGGKK